LWALITTITKQKKPKILIKLYVAREILVEMIEWTNEWGECEKDRERDTHTHNVMTRVSGPRVEFLREKINK